ncbi:hypothetical protein NC980_14970 [Leptolyngbya sp. AS-A5]|nr:hypothetical protein [Leptolyngbya sp. FACHB-17]
MLAWCAGVGDELAIEVEIGERSTIGGIVAAKPVQEVKEFLDEVEGFLFGDWGGLMNGDIS